MAFLTHPSVSSGVHVSSPPAGFWALSRQTVNLATWILHKKRVKFVVVESVYLSLTLKLSPNTCLVSNRKTKQTEIGPPDPNVSLGGGADSLLLFRFFFALVSFPSHVWMWAQNFEASSVSSHEGFICEVAGNWSLSSLSSFCGNVA